MPEMPEVETIRRDLARHVLRKRIAAVEVRKKRLVKSPLAAFVKTLHNNRIVRLARRGKLLIAYLKSGRFLLIHLKMTGQLIYQDKKILAAGGHGDLLSLRATHTTPRIKACPDESHGYGAGSSPSSKRRGIVLPNKHSYIIFTFADGSKLFFNDQRQFGYMKIADKDTLARILSDYGIEPLSRDFTSAKFRGLIKGRAAPIKPILLNQKFIAGIGNIYADEICFSARLLPKRRGASLQPEEINRLFHAIRKVLSKAIKMRGTTFRDFRDGRGQKGNFSDYLNVYGRAGQACRHCRAKLMRIRSGGRGTVYCPRCQK